MRTIIVWAASLTVALSATPALAQIPVAGTFTAQQSCPATTSIRGGNRGGTTLEPGRTYRVLGKNKDDATFYQLLVDGARRWVPVACGELQGAAASSGTQATYVLAMSWEPAFCGDHAAKPECQHPSTQRLALHGLWPQPRGKAYCGVDPAIKQADKAPWDRLPEPQITDATRQRLAAAMPGVESGLQRHEWIVHGTCSGLNPDQYFTRAADLAEQVNASAVPAVFSGSLGRSVDSDAIRAAFDQSFGQSAGARVLVLCHGRGNARAVTELDIALAGDVNGSARLPDLMLAAAPRPDPGCPGGRIAAPG